MKKTKTKRKNIDLDLIGFFAKRDLRNVGNIVTFLKKINIIFTKSLRNH